MEKALDKNTPDRAVPRSKDICHEDSCVKIHSEEKKMHQKIDYKVSFQG